VPPLVKQPDRGTPLLPYIAAIGSVLLALAARQLLDPILGDRIPFGTFFIAVMVIAWWTGVKPTLLALALSSLVADFLYVPPRNALGFASPADFMSWLIFFAVGLASAVISEAHRRAIHRAEATAADLAQEIGQHRRTLAAYQNKEGELRDFIENSITPLHWVDREGRIIWANQAELDLLGYTKEEYIGQPIAKFHADEAVISDILGCLARDEVLQNYEARLRHRNGSILSVLLNSSVYRENGEFIHTRCSTTDITERKAAEVARARLSAIVQNSDAAIVSKALDSTITSWNAGAERMFGYTEEEMVGQSIRILFPPELLPEEERFLERVGRGEHIDHYETVRLRKDGQRINISVTLSPIRDSTGTIIGISKIAQDITERKAAEAIRARLSAIVQYSDDAIVSKTLDSTIVSWNAGAQRIFGYTEEEVVGKSIRILFPPELLPEEDMFLERIGRGEHIDHFETVRVRKDGQRINISVTISPIKDERGNIIGASKIAQDITERKRDEQRNHLLLELSTAFSRALTLNQSAEVVVEQALNKLGASLGLVCLLVENGTALEILNLHGLPPSVAQAYRQTPLSLDAPLNEAVRTHQMVWIENREDYLKRYPQLETSPGIQSTICLPLQVDEKVIGGIALSFPTEKRRNPKEEAFFTTLAYLSAQSLERARLYEAEQQERDLAEALRDTLVALSSTWDRSAIFDEILANLDRVVQHDMADIMLLEDGEARVVRSHGYAEHGLVRTEREMQRFSLRISETPTLKWVAERKCPLIVEDTHHNTTWVHLEGLEAIRSSLIVPIIIDSAVVGFLTVNGLLPDFFTPGDGERLQVFANHAAIAIRNANLYQQALTMAASEERQRIARDLHDAVSQTLFSANVVAESLPRLWERQPGKAIAQTESLHQLTRAAAAEMRVLLFELRPESLVQNNLSYLLTQLGYSLHGRKKIDLSLVLRDPIEQPLPPEIQIAFYRIAQESLNNVIKHGQAKAVRIRLHRTADTVTLTITDNGLGFDTRGRSTGIGLSSMRERAESIGAAFAVRSKPGRGTRVRVTWQAEADSRDAA
jgi:PAS domain S-box-containing protein